MLTNIKSYNILFGGPFDEERYWKVINDTCLLPDIRLLTDSDLTEMCITMTIIVVSTEDLYIDWTEGY